MASRRPLVVHRHDRNIDDFGFDAQMLAEIIWVGVVIGEVSCPTVYFPEASSFQTRP